MGVYGSYPKTMPNLKSDPRFGISDLDLGNEGWVKRDFNRIACSTEHLVFSPIDANVNFFRKGYPLEKKSSEIFHLLIRLKSRLPPLNRGR